MSSPYCTPFTVLRLAHQPVHRPRQFSSARQQSHHHHQRNRQDSISKSSWASRKSKISVTYLAPDRAFPSRKWAPSAMKPFARNMTCPSASCSISAASTGASKSTMLLLAYTYVGEADGDTFPLVIAGREPAYDDRLFPDICVNTAGKLAISKITCPLDRLRRRSGQAGALSPGRRIRIPQPVRRLRLDGVGSAGLGHAGRDIGRHRL